MLTSNNQSLKIQFVFEYWPDLRSENRQTRDIAFYLDQPDQFLDYLFKLPKIEYGFHGGLQIEIDGQVWEPYDEPWLSVRYLDALEKLLKNEVEEIDISVWEESDLHLQRINDREIEMEEAERNQTDEIFGQKIRVNLPEFSQAVIAEFKKYLELIKKLEEILKVKYLSELQKMDERGRTYRQAINEEIFLSAENLPQLIETLEALAKA